MLCASSHLAIPVLTIICLAPIVLECLSKRNYGNFNRRVEGKEYKVVLHASFRLLLPPLDVINSIWQDDVSFHIRTDSLICSYVEALFAKHGRVKPRHQYISQRMRELGRFTLVAKSMDTSIKGLEDLCALSRFQFVISVARKATEFSPGKNAYGTPSTAVKIGFCLL